VAKRFLTQTTEALFSPGTYLSSINKP